MSKIEERHIDISHQEYLPFTFKDSTGKAFKAKADALLNMPDGEIIYVELKECELNDKRNKATADNKIRSQYSYHFNQEEIDARKCEQRLYYSGHNYDVLLHAWHHAAKKHQAVSEELKKHGIRYIVVFASHPPEVEYYKKSYTFKHYYKKRYNLETMLESEFLELKAQAVPVTTH